MVGTKYVYQEGDILNSLNCGFVYKFVEYKKNKINED